MQVRFERPSGDDQKLWDAFNERRRWMMHDGFNFEGQRYFHFTHKDADKEDKGDKGQMCAAPVAVTVVLLLHRCGQMR